MQRMTPPNPLTAVPVFYHPSMATTVASFSPSAAKPTALVTRWTVERRPIEIREPMPVGIEDFCRVHDPRFVADILELRASNGFGNRRPEVAATLPWTSGSMLAAAREAAANRQVAVSPTSGFHHARYDASANFCTFNGLLVAAAALRANDPHVRVGILDCDHHFGDGTTEICQRLGLDWVIHYSAAADYDQPSQARRFLDRLPERMDTFRHCNVLIYQAGADPHVDDPLGGWLSTAQMYQRDLIVFQHARRLGLPVAWNLAGGYQQTLSKVLDLHTNTLRACIETFLPRHDALSRP